MVLIFVLIEVSYFFHDGGVLISALIERCPNFTGACPDGEMFLYQGVLIDLISFRGVLLRYLFQKHVLG